MPASAQDGAALTPPDSLSLSSITAQREALAKRGGELSDAQIISANTFYDTAASALKDAQANLEEAQRLGELIASAPKLLETLEREIAEARDLPLASFEGDASTLDAARLSGLQKSLITKEAQLRALRIQQEDYRAALETLQNRRVTAPEEQAQALSKTSELTAQIAGRANAGQGPVDLAQTAALEARLFFRRTQSAMLEVEIASAAEQQKLLSARERLAQLQFSRLSADITALQGLTGEQRKIDAQKFVTQAQNMVTTLAPQTDGSDSEPQTPPARPTHPLVMTYADENLELAKYLLDIANDASEIPRRLAQKRGQIDILEGDLNTSVSLIELGNLSRQSAATLRQLRNNNDSTAVVNAEIKTLNQSIAVATQNRLLVQSRLRELGLGEADTQTLYMEWLEEDPIAAPLLAPDIAQFQTLHSQRREILGEIIETARDRLDDLNQLKTTLDTLLVNTQDLTTALDTNLLWLPSTPVLDSSWPRKVLNGAAAIFSPRHVSLVWSTIVSSGLRNLPVVIILLLAAGGAYSMRPKLLADIEHRAAMVGRVQKDNYLHTPIVIFACIIIAAPLAIIFYLLSVIFALTRTTDPFIGSVQDSFFCLSIFTLIVLTWRAWDRDLSVFDTHFNLSPQLRIAVNKQMKWFIPFIGASTALIELTADSNDPNVFEGLSVAAFLVTTCTLSFMAYKILWTRRSASGKVLNNREAAKTYWGVFAGIMIIAPLVFAVCTGLGYYDTTSEILYRLFISGCLLVASYVIYGTTRRSVLISKRRLALRQAVERRDLAVKARQEQKDAQDRGEDIVAPPAVNYEQIDIETVSRQTEKLLNAFMFVLFAAVMWMIWSDLLPALGFFDKIELGHYVVETIDTETNAMVTVERAITLWNILQAIIIFGLTLLAGRNLPGFLEIFVLNRLGVDAGTRYAIVTILGYIILGIGLFISLDKLGLQWSQLKWVITGLSVGIGLGLQKIIANFVSGLIILFERPVRLGDYVTIGEQSGTVTRIQIRATTLVDLDNREILIPNEELISQRVTNWTLSNSITRLVINVGIAYGSDTDAGRDIMLAVLKENKLVLGTPPPQVIFAGFGDSSLDFEVRAFLKTFEDRIPTRHALHTEINKALEAAGFSIPFPQRDLRIITQPEKLAAAKAPKKTAKKTPKKTAKTKKTTKSQPKKA